MNDLKTIKIAFIVPYFGNWPIWFPAFLKSCEFNQTITWIFFTDCDVTVYKPTNVIFHNSSLEQIKHLACSKLGIQISIENTRKLCDLKPAYGDIFSDYLIEYEYWGFCDIDIIWGNIRGFITDQLLKEYDIITSLKETISGHFTLIKNTKINALLYRHNGIFKALFQHKKYQWFDEDAFTKIIAELKKDNLIKVYWDKPLLEKGIESVAHQEYFLDKWLFNNGKVFQINSTTNKEYMYLHFINWKRTMKNCEINFLNYSNIFYISYTKIHIIKHAKFKILLNNTKNLFNGYHILIRRKKIIKNICRLKSKYIRKVISYK